MKAGNIKDKRSQFEVLSTQFKDSRKMLLTQVGAKPSGIEIETIPIRIDDPDLNIGTEIEIEKLDRDRKSSKSHTLDRIKNLTPLLL